MLRGDLDRAAVDRVGLHAAGVRMPTVDAAAQMGGLPRPPQAVASRKSTTWAGTGRGFIGRALFGTGLGDFFDLRTWVLALVDSLILLGVYRLVARRRGRS